MTEQLDLERPDERWAGANWHGPRGTALRDWLTEVRAIEAAIREREQVRGQRKDYASPASVAWRLDCLADLAAVLEHNIGRI